MLEEFLQDIQQQHSPDAFINLGDLIRSEGKELDLQAYRRLIDSFGQVSHPVIHLLGLVG